MTQYDEAITMGNRVIFMKEGKITEIREWATIVEIKKGQLFLFLHNSSYTSSSIGADSTICVIVSKAPPASDY